MAPELTHLFKMRPDGVESKNAMGARKTACSMLSKNALAVASPEKAISVDLRRWSDVSEMG